MVIKRLIPVIALLLFSLSFGGTGVTRYFAGNAKVVVISDSIDTDTAYIPVEEKYLHSAVDFWVTQEKYSGTTDVEVKAYFTFDKYADSSSTVLLDSLTLQSKATAESTLTYTRYDFQDSIKYEGENGSSYVPIYSFYNKGYTNIMIKCIGQTANDSSTYVFINASFIKPVGWK